VFEHPNGIYAEFDASDERQSPTLGTVRLWDFTKADPRFQSEQGRSEIAGREQEVIAYLQDRCDRCDEVIIGGKTRDPNFGVHYWEVYDRRRRLLRLRDFLTFQPNEITQADRIELARQLLAALNALHLAEASHLDLGSHSIWIQRPSTVRLSHLMAASYPQIKSLGTDRYQFLATGRLPEDEFGDKASPKRRDVFLAAMAVHNLLFGIAPGASSGCPEWNAAADADVQFPELHGWFETALGWDPATRFASAGDALAAFNAAIASQPGSAEVLEGLERHRSGSVRSQMQLFQLYPPLDVIRDDETGALWRSHKDGSDVLVKMWKRSAWVDQQREGPRILDFLNQVKELAISAPSGCARVLDGIWLGDAIVMIQEWQDKPDLERLLRDNPEDLDEEARLALLSALTNNVADLHINGLAHGDLKPANILVDPKAPEDPVIVDLIDFTAAEDGEQVTTKYAPEVGDRYERDCYAVTVIAEEMLVDCCSGRALRVHDAIAKVRTSIPPNATLLPLVDAFAAAEPHQEEQSVVSLVSPFMSTGVILPDEGRYFLRRAPYRRALVIRGACEEIEIEVNADGIPIQATRRPLEQARIRFLTRFEFDHLEVKIVIENGPVTDLSSIKPILDRSSVIEALAPMAPLTSDTDPTDAPQDEQEAAPGEPPEDDLIEAIAAAPPPTGLVDVAQLWAALVDTEEELITYGQATEDSAFDRATSRHKLHFDLATGSFDYNRRDRVRVEKADNKGHWRSVAYLDLQKSRPDSLFLESVRPQRKGDAPLVQGGDELRFISHFEETSLDRRQAAVKRIIARASRTRDLIDIMDPRKATRPQFISNVIEPETLQQRYGLNEQQASALSAVLATRPFALVQGPPGTGKTVFIAALVHAALTHGFARNVLLASQAHEAVNNAAEAVLKQFAHAGEVPSILRVGNESVVSDRLLPFHVERVEQLQKDRFRAEMRERLAIASKGLGISEEVGAILTHVELAIRPVATRLANIGAEDNVEQRSVALRETIRLQLAQIGVDEAIAFEALPETIVSDVVNSYLKHLPHSDRPSADRVARFQDVAALGRDFVGAVSTEQRSLETFLAGTRQIVAGTCVGLGRSALGLTSIPLALIAFSVDKVLNRWRRA
jgi:hypothetical protein